MVRANMISDDIVRLPRSQRRLRWPLVLAMVCLLLAACGSIFWTYFRPLTVVEQRLVGTWRTSAGPSVFTFHSDRTVTARGYAGGRWFARENRLYWYDSLLEEAKMSLLRPEIDRSHMLTFEDDDNISVFVPVSGFTSQWQRVPNPQKAATDQQHR